MSKGLCVVHVVLLMYYRFYCITVWTVTDISLAAVVGVISVTQWLHYFDTAPNVVLPRFHQHDKTSGGYKFKVKASAQAMMRVCCHSEKQQFVSFSDLIRKPDDEWMEVGYLTEKLGVCSMFTDSHILCKNTHCNIQTDPLSTHVEYNLCEATATGNARLALGNY